MSRRNRISRGLIGLLVVTIVLGGAFYLHNVSRSDASEAAEPQRASRPEPRPAVPVPAPVRTVQPAPVRSAGPATLPVTPIEQSNTLARGDAPSGLAETLVAPNVIAAARAKQDSGDLIAARQILNDALLTSRLSPGDTDAAKRMLAEINRIVIFSPKHFANDMYGGTYTVKSGQLLRSIADQHEIPWELLARINGISDPRKLRAGQTIKVIKGPFHSVVSKSRYTLEVYLGPPGETGSLYVMSFPVGLGANDSTPVGSWLVETHKKLKNPTYFSPRGEGVIDAHDPKNPLGERWIGLIGIDGAAVGQQSYGIHGTIEPETIGRQASMGCIRMRNEDVELLFDMLVEGKSTVVVKD